MKNNDNNPTIVGISCGDLNGIGPEVILKTFEDPMMLELCTPVVFANARLFSYLKKVLKLKLSIHSIDSLQDVEHGKFNVWNTWREGVNIEFGTLDESVGKYAVKSLKESVAALKQNLIDVLVTAPINKANTQSEDFPFAGHTGFLNQELEGEATMFMISENIKVALLTEHLPLQEVSKNISKELIVKKVESLRKTLIQDFAITEPKIAVLGLNPHSGDGGVIGKEEQETIEPAVNELRGKNYLVFGPYPADAFFGTSNYKNFDAILACYHDQGLIPFKALSFGEGVNFTAGLSHIRTSPDHGTAYDIAGKGEAIEDSFRTAVYAAIDLYKNRAMHNEYAKNPLRSNQKK